ncbi:MAG: hypothetical protein JSS00_07220 [Proteobacteria bacterium]|nr:hypothetical protein [Pseudomonadota bacterium]
MALTSLDLEHTELLGTTLLEIGLEKIDAAPPGANLYAGVWSSERVELARRCALVGVRYVSCPPVYPEFLPLFGRHQNQNASLAMHIAMSLTGLEGEILEPRFAQTRWPGRLELIEREPLVVIDVGHTPAGVRTALDGFQEMRAARRGVLVCGVSRDKKAAELIAILAPAFDVIICASAAHKGAPAAEIAALANAANPTAELTIAESVADARRLALAKAKSAETAIYVAGSLFLAVEFKALHVGRDPASLAFF